MVNDPAERAVALVKFLKEHHFQPKDNQEFQHQMIAIDVSRRKDQLTRDDIDLLSWYTNLPTLGYDDLTDDEEEPDNDQ